ncbi:MAG: alpha-ketoglutarate-dependent dioxygenase AlkB [Acidimicrobiia bacterium]
MAAAIVHEALPLFGQGALAPDRTFGATVRHRLAASSWVEHQHGWLSGSDTLFDALVSAVPWQQHRRPMYDRLVDEPRLTAWYPAGATWPHPVLAELASALSERYGQRLANLGLNLYRDGADSVAWHGDRIGRAYPEPVVAIVSLGAPRPFLLRPRGGGGRCRRFTLGWGDLLVMGGRCQQELDHAVPKVAAAGPRLSVMFRPHDEGWVQRVVVSSRRVSPA